MLSELSDAPLALFVSGDLTCLNRPAIAIVGTRRPSKDGLKLADQMGYELASAGFLVVSGLAHGIDAAAHRGALRSGGQTLAVMATGMDRIYPAHHYRLAEDVAAQGALVSEFCPGVAPHRGHFPRRNRTLSGLCLATLVVEAGHPSGSLLTANAAVQQGREVFAAPWSLFHKNGSGCLHLLSQGAQLLTTPKAIIEQLGVHLSGWAALVSQDMGNRPEAAPTIRPASLDPLERRLLTLLGDGEHDLGSLAAALQCSSRRVLTLVTQLELRGYVAQTSAGLKAVRHL
jgi:DNA processing protein